MIAGIALCADPKDAALMAGKAADVFLDCLDVLEDATCCAEDSLTRWGQDQALSYSQKDRGPEPVFDRAQLMAHRRLRAMQFFRRAGDASRTGNGRDHLQITYIEVHDHSS